jgi:hypothetical protein
MWEPRRLTILWAFTACYRDILPLKFLKIPYSLLPHSVGMSEKRKIVTHMDTQIWGRNEDGLRLMDVALDRVAACKAQNIHALCRLHIRMLPVGHKLAIHRSITDNGRHCSSNTLVSLNCCPVTTIPVSHGAGIKHCKFMLMPIFT